MMRPFQWDCTCFRPVWNSHFVIGQQSKVWDFRQSDWSVFPTNSSVQTGAVTAVTPSAHVTWDPSSQTPEAIPKNSWASLTAQKTGEWENLRCDTKQLVKLSSQNWCIYIYIYIYHLFRSFTNSSLRVLTGGSWGPSQTWVVLPTPEDYQKFCVFTVSWNLYIHLYHNEVLWNICPAKWSYWD